MRNSELEYSNYSTDKKVAFIEKGHKYIHLDRPDLNFTSVTTLIAQYKDKFDGESVAKKCVADINSKYYGQDWQTLALSWEAYGKECAESGTELHSYGEALFNGNTDIVAPDSPKAKHAQDAVKYLLSHGYKLATTEMLVYSEDVKIAGQSDIILKKKPLGAEDYDYMIYDWKFINKELERKSYYSKRYGYRMMSGPFCKLMDCAWIHYSIQMALYQTLTGEPARVTEKVLIIVQDDKYTFVPAYPMRVFWDQNNELQCVHEIYNGRWWDSRMQTLYKRKPSDIVGI